MPRRRKPAGLECLVDLARKAEILEREMSLQRQAIERLTSTSAHAARKAATARPTPSSPSLYPGIAR